MTELIEVGVSQFERFRRAIVLPEGWWLEDRGFNAPMLWWKAFDDFSLKDLNTLCREHWHITGASIGSYGAGYVKVAGLDVDLKEGELLFAVSLVFAYLDDGVGRVQKLVDALKKHPLLEKDVEKLTLEVGEAALAVV